MYMRVYAIGRLKRLLFTVLFALLVLICILAADAWRTHISYNCSSFL